MRRARVALHGGTIVSLTRTEWRVLKLLLLARGQIVSREQIMDWLYWKDPDPPFDRVIHQYVFALRRRFLGTALSIHTENSARGRGWRVHIRQPERDE